MAKRRESLLISTSTSDSNSGGSEDMESGGESERYAVVLTHQPHQNGGIPRNTESMLRTSTAASDYRPHEKNEGYKQMKAKNIRQQRVFYTLMVLCFIVTLAYIGVIVFLLSAHSQTDVGSNPGPSSTATAKGQRIVGGQNDNPQHPYCVMEEDVRAHADLYQDVSYLKLNRGTTICFQSLEWFPKIIQRVNASIHDRAATIEDKHKKMSDDLAKIGTSFDSTPKTQTKAVVDDLSSSRHAVFAHLYLNNSATANHSDTLKWKKAGVDDSDKRRINLNTVTGEVIVRESGSYFVYSHVMFLNRAGNRALAHQVVKNYRSGNAKEVLLETDQGPASILQGVFRLMVNDTLSVRVASPDQLNKDSGRFTYFGTYLMRT